MKNEAPICTAGQRPAGLVTGRLRRRRLHDVGQRPLHACGLLSNRCLPGYFGRRLAPGAATTRQDNDDLPQSCGRLPGRHNGPPPTSVLRTADVDIVEAVVYAADTPPPCSVAVGPSPARPRLLHLPLLTSPRLSFFFTPSPREASSSSPGSVHSPYQMLFSCGHDVFCRRQGPQKSHRQATDDRGEQAHTAHRK